MRHRHPLTREWVDDGACRQQLAVHIALGKPLCIDAADADDIGWIDLQAALTDGDQMRGRDEFVHVNHYKAKGERVERATMRTSSQFYFGKRAAA